MPTHDELFRDAAFPDSAGSAAAKEVARCGQALSIGFEAVKSTSLLTNNYILRIQSELERNTAGFRKVPGTALKTGDGRIVYMPPQDPSMIVELMADLELRGPTTNSDGTTGLGYIKRFEGHAMPAILLSLRRKAQDSCLGHLSRCAWLPPAAPAITFSRSQTHAQA